MKVTISKRKAAAGAACACALAACLGASAAFAAGSVSAASDADENVPTSVTTTTGDYIKGAATRAAGPALEILGLASVEESGQFVDTTSWYSWSQPKYYLAASDYNTELSPFLANLATGTGTDEYPSAVLNSSRAGGGSGPNASLATSGDESDESVWALDPDVVVGTGGSTVYPDDVYGVAYSFSDYTDLVATMDAIADAADAADANVSSRSLRYGSAADIAQDYEEYIFGTIGAVAEAIADDSSVSKKTIALVESVEEAEDGYVYNLMTTTEAENDGTASTNRYLETTSDNGLGDALDLADNLANTYESVSASELEVADLILVGGQQSSSNYDSIVKALFEDGLLADTYFVEDNGSAGAMYGVVMNSVENAQNIGRILGCLYPEVVDQQDWLAYYYETFYHIDADELATVMDSALDGVRCWSVQELDSSITSADAAITTLGNWDAGYCGYTSDAGASAVAATISEGYEYYQEAVATADTAAAETEETATAQLATASTASVLSTASLSTQGTEDTESTDSYWTVTDSSGNETTYSSFSDITLVSGDTVTLTADVTENIEISPDDPCKHDSFTVDLAGHTINGKITVGNLDAATLTITSSSEDKGKIFYDADNSSTNSVTAALTTSAGNVDVSNIDITAQIRGKSSTYFGCSVYVTNGTELTMTDVDVLHAPYSEDSGFTLSVYAMCIVEGNVTLKDSSVITKSSDPSSCTSYINCVGGSGSSTKSITAENSVIGVDLGEDTVADSTARVMRAIYAYYMNVSLVDCEVYASGTGSRGAYGIVTSGSAEIDLESCVLWTSTGTSSYSKSMSTATAGTISLAGDMLITSPMGLGTKTQTYLDLVKGLNLIEPVTIGTYYSTFAVDLVSTTDEDGNTSNWTTDEAKAVANMFSCTDTDGTTYGAQVTYSEDDETLPASLSWNEGGVSSATSVTASSSSSTCESSLTATVYDSNSEEISGASVSWVYYADEDCTQPLSEKPSENGTYYCKALYAGNYDSGYLASVSSATEFVVGHTYSGVVTAPTCTTAGYTTYTCSVCGATYTEAIAATGHSYTTVVTAPTCTEAGYTTYTCSVCGDTYTADETEATGHSYDDGVVTAPTCTGAGYTTYTCSVCGDTYTADVVLATGHTPGTAVTENAVAATCGTDGSYDTVVYCTVCGAEISRVTTTEEATGEHSYEATKTLVEATCTTAGATTYTCSVCGATKTEVDEAPGHSYDDGVVTAATCTEAGYTTYTCTRCGDTYTADETEALGHSWDEGTVTTAATCTEDGVLTYTCANDSSHTYTEAIAATGHDYVGTVTTEATCGAEGVMTYTCANDSSHTYTEAIAATGEHTYGAGVLSEDGQTLTFTCTVCGYSYTQDVSAVYEAAYEDGYDDAETAANDTASEDSAYNVGYNAGVAAATPASLSGATVAVAKSSCTYTGKAIEPAVTVTLSDGTVLVEGTDYTLVYLNNESVGTATVLVVGAGSYTGAATGSFAIVQAKQSLKVTKKAKTAKYSKVKKKAVTLKAITKVTGAKGTVSYSLVSAKKGSKSFKAKFKVNAKNGKITVKKGTKKGTYKVKVKVSAAATAGYKAASKTVTVKIKVK